MAARARQRWRDERFSRSLRDGRFLPMKGDFPVGVANVDHKERSQIFDYLKEQFRNRRAGRSESFFSSAFKLSKSVMLKLMRRTISGSTAWLYSYRARNARQNEALQRWSYAPLDGRRRSGSGNCS